MIVFYAQGGLGNQLFQYAAARRLAVKRECPLVLDPHWFSHPGHGETPRPLELTRYPLDIRIADATEQRRWRWMRNRFARHLQLLQPLTLVREEGIGINQAALNAPNDSYMIGFWQSEKYFDDIRQTLQRELTPLARPTATDEAVINLIRRSNAVSVHVRRGDYVTLQNASVYHGLCSLDYYRAAIELVAARVVDPTLFIFSDDPEWTREHFVTPFPTHYVDHNRAHDAFQDLRLMSLCRHHVLANSSFSWWAAWLGEPQERLVISPARWYAVERPTPDLIPARWIRI